MPLRYLLPIGKFDYAVGEKPSLYAPNTEAAAA
jgi:hypothetical protein